MTPDTPEGIAEWMLKRFTEEGWLEQRYVAFLLHADHGEVFVSRNARGELNIRPDVLAAFEVLSGNAIVFDHSRRLWRTRTHDDKETRGQRRLP